MTVGAEQWVELILADQPRLREQCADFPTGIVHCTLSPLGRQLWVQISPSPRFFKTAPPPSTDTPPLRLHLRGSAGAWWAMLRKHDWTGLEIRGEPAFRDALEQLLRELALDWEALLEPYLGEDLLGVIMQSLRSTELWWTRQGESLREDVREYLVFELQWLPEQYQLHSLQRDLTRLGTDLEQLDQRIAALEEPRGRHS